MLAHGSIPALRSSRYSAAWGAAGNNRLPCFLDDEDRQRYLQCLRQALLRFGCKLHAYVLMSNHVHLLLTPGGAGALSRSIHTFARNCVGSFNGRHGRTGTLWEGRYKACLAGSDRCFLACSRYIELNPVRAWMVAHPGDYPWSSYGAHADQRIDPLLVPHPEYLALGTDPVARASAYRALFADALPDPLVAEIRTCLQQEKALGSDRFRSWVRSEVGPVPAVRRTGRPPHRSKCP